MADSLTAFLARIKAGQPAAFRDTLAVIAEHYLPTQAGGELPASDIGAIVSIADKLDTICGCFGVGLIPTGSADPYALRRSAIGIINIILDRGYRVSLRNGIDKALRLLGAKLAKKYYAGRDPIGQSVRLDGRPYTVIGVLAGGVLLIALVLPIAFTFARLGRRYPHAGGAPRAATPRRQQSSASRRRAPPDAERGHPLRRLQRRDADAGARPRGEGGGRR